jgi:hypothetical protein
MRIDVHTHVFPPQIVGDRSRFFDGEAAFRLLYDSPKARLATVESLLEAMDRDHIDWAVVFGFPWKEVELSARHNDYVLESAAKYGARLIPLACMDPAARKAAAEAERCFANGAYGLGELAVYEQCDTGAALRSFGELIDCCRAAGRLLLIHANEPVGHRYPGKAPLGLDFYYELARLAAGMPLIFAHWGGGLGFYSLLKREAPDVLAQVYYDTAASPFLYRPAIYAEMVRILGPERILFGSDYPLLTPARYDLDLAASGLNPEHAAAIMGGNALHLLQSMQLL